MVTDDWSMAKCISVLHRYSQCYVGKKLEDRGIGSGQYGIFLTLFLRSGVSQEELAGYLKTDKGCIARSVKKLERAGYVERFADDEDKRAYKVYLTQKARDIVPEIRRAAEGWEEWIASGLSEGERRDAERLLRVMAEKAISKRFAGTADNEENRV